MAGIALQCACGRRLTVRAELAGTTGRCPSCQQLIRIPSPKAAMAAAAPADAKSTQGNCAICQTSIPGGEAINRCQACHLPYHADCWQDYGGCATYGCEEAPKQEKTSADATKECPYCAEIIRAKALRCPSCRERFEDARPVDREEYINAQVNAPMLRSFQFKCLAYLVASTVPCLGIVALVIGIVWLKESDKRFTQVSSVYRVMVQAGVACGSLHTVLFILFLLALGAA